MLSALPNSCHVDALLSAYRQASNPGQIASTQLQIGQDALDKIFDNTAISDLVAARADLVDQVLLSAWAWFELEQETDLALIAVGGYGRRELHPASDTDLLLLCRNEPLPLSSLVAKVEAFIAFLWDAGLGIGHSLRSLVHCTSLASDNITVATNIMESRLLSGDSTLLADLLTATAADKMWPIAEFFDAKINEQQARHNKFNDTEYSLEPDIKKAPGGLRDLHTIQWVTRRYFGSQQLDDLVARGFITQREQNYLLRSRDLLWRIRWWLHRLADRNENRLLFDYQRDIAQRLGYREDNANLAVEHFMQDYYRCALALSVLNGLALQLFEEVVLQEQQEQLVYPINRHFQLRNNYLETVADDTFERHPTAILEAFSLQAQSDDIKGIRAVTIRRMFEARRYIDDKFRHHPDNTKRFMSLLRNSNDPYQQLLAMKRYGILAQYLPEFGAIVGMMQYDLFHLYTVDAHTLLVLKNLRQLRAAKQGHRLSLVTQIIYRLPKPELLYVAGLYHDIAKGRDGDHSVLGANEAEDFCQRHNLSRWDTHLVSWLVKNHLLMSVTAQRKDISDPSVVHDFARQVGDMVHLDYLYVLTIADISATNPSLWNSWRDALLRQLHQETTRALRRGLDKPINKHEWINEARTNAIELLRERGITGLQVSSLLASFGDEYFLRETANNIAWHCEAILKHPQATTAAMAPLVLTREPNGVDYRGGTQLFVYAADNKNLFAATVNALDHLDLTIVDARIITSTHGFSLDTYVVLDKDGKPIGNDPARLEAIQTELEHTLKTPERFADLVERLMPRRHRHFDVPTQVLISNNLRNGYTVVDIETLDRPGLLAQIGRIFMRFDLLIQNARIATFGERAEDTFLVTDSDGMPLSDPAIGEALRSCLEQELPRLSSITHLDNS